MTKNLLPLIYSFLLVFSLILNAPLSAMPTQNDFLILDEILCSGFGAELSAVLGALDEYDKGNIAGFEVNFNSGFYLDPPTGPNWWNYYFAQISLGEKRGHPQYHCTLQDACELSGKAFNQISRKEHYKLISKYIRVVPAIRDFVNDYTACYFKGYYVLGIHHRGTDKINETSIVDWELSLRVLQHTISQLSRKNLSKLKIYVATDDQNFLEYLQQIYPSYVIFGDFHRSINNAPLHTYEASYYANNYEKGKEALVEALILSKCDALIRPASSGFSWISMIFNPKMPVNSINSDKWEFPGTWFPQLK